MKSLEFAFEINWPLSETNSSLVNFAVNFGISFKVNFEVNFGELR